MTPDVPAFRQRESRNLIIEKMPDGSTAVFDVATQTLHSLNPPAAAALEAFRARKTLPELARIMAQALSSPVTEDLALAAAAELERAGLLVSEGIQPPSRFDTGTTTTTYDASSAIDCRRSQRYCA